MTNSANDGQSALTITNSTLSGNRARLGGAGLVQLVAGGVTVRNSVISGNSVPDSFDTGAPGLGLALIGGDVTVESTVFADNTTPWAHPGAHWW